MKNTDTIRLLLGHSDEIEAQRLASMLNNSGYPNRAVQADSIEVFNKHLQDSGWDAVIVHAEQGTVLIRDAFQAIRKLDLEVPVIGLTELEHHVAIVDGMKHGAHDVVPLDHDQHLMLVLKRALQGVQRLADEQAAVRKAKDLEKRNHELLASSRDGVAFVEDGVILYANEAFATSLGYEDVDEIDCMPIFDLIVDEHQERYTDFFKAFMADKEHNEQAISLTFVGPSGNHNFSLQVNMGRFEDQDAAQLTLKTEPVINDANSQIDVETGLFNRRAILDLSETELQTRHSGHWWQIRLNNFDELSLEAGVQGIDDLLTQIGEQLTALVPEHDIGRLNDDNIALWHSSDDITVSTAALHELVEAIEDHLFTFGNRTFHWHVYAALVPVTKGIDSPSILIDRAMKSLNKATDEARVQIYEAPLSDDQARRKKILDSINDALENDKFKLQFQPVVSLQDQGNHVYEALLRMVNESGELIEAYKFIEEAERSGATSLIDRWTIRESFKKLAEQKDHTKLIINISAGLLQDQGIIEWLEKAIEYAKIDPALVTLQIRETVATEYMTLAQEFCKQVNKLGLQVCISHFGCVMNYMKVLDQLPIHLVKLDQTYTQDLQKGDKDAITNLLTSLGQKGVLSIIPFVESATTLASLWTMGVHFIQGHYLQAPADDMNYDFEGE